MAYDKTQGAARLAGAFAKIATESPAKAATQIVADAIAGEIAKAFKDAEVEVRVKFTAQVDAVPSTVEVDETVKGEIK